MMNWTSRHAASRETGRNSMSWKRDILSTPPCHLAHTSNSSIQVYSTSMSLAGKRRGCSVKNGQPFDKISRWFCC